MSALMSTAPARAANPLDALEQIAVAYDWAFDRRSDSEMAAEAPGKVAGVVVKNVDDEIFAASVRIAADDAAPRRRELTIAPAIAPRQDAARLWCHFGGGAAIRPE